MTERGPDSKGGPQGSASADHRDPACVPDPSERRRELINDALAQARRRALRKGRRFTVISRLGDTALFETTTSDWVKRIYRVRLTSTDKVIIERVR